MFAFAKTNRGFGVVSFNDSYGAKCSIQQSSAIGNYGDSADHPGCSYLWVGVDDPDPKILASKASEHGVRTSETCGWVPYPVPDDVTMTTSMHLSREQVAELIGTLQRWLDTGELGDNA